MRFLVITCFCILNFFADAMNNGEYHPITDFPYVAQIKVISRNGRKHFCGAAILSADWVISAAHCASFVDSVVGTLIITGSSLTLQGENLINVEKIFIPGHLEMENLSGDVCLLKLKTPIKFNEYQQLIKITRKYPKDGDNVTVAGYGYHRHGVFGSTLRSARVQVADHKYCSDIYQKLYEVSLTDNQFCTTVKEVELVSGDSGSPAVLDDKLVGIMAGGSGDHSINGYTKIASYYDWIIQTTGIKYDD